MRIIIIENVDLMSELDERKLKEALKRLNIEYRDAVMKKIRS